MSSQATPPEVVVDALGVPVGIPVTGAAAARLRRQWSRALTDRPPATVVDLERGACQQTLPEDGITCSTPTVRLEEGPDAGEEIELFEEADESGLALSEGEEVVVGWFPGAGEGFEYSLVDYERRPPLLLLTALFAVAVVALGRWKGLRALAGVGVSIAVLAAFILPALLDGSSPIRDRSILTLSIGSRLRKLNDE